MIDSGRTWWVRRWLACVLAGLSCWGWQFWPAYQQGKQVMQQLQEMEQQDMPIMNADGGDEGPWAPARGMARSPQINHSERGPLPAQAVAPTRAVGDVAAVVQWHALMRQHQLSGWQGRVVPGNPTSSGAAHPSAGLGDIWRLEGPASYAQGVALLDALAHDFPGVMLLHVQVRHAPDGYGLRWLVELRWTADGFKLAPLLLWPQVLASVSDPFSPDRLKPVPDEVPAPSLAVRTGAHVLPTVSVRAMRLAGVVSGGQGRQALVTTSVPSGVTTSAVNPGVSPVPAWHALREGQVVGEERARVLAIETRRVVLEQPGPVAATGKSPPLVLELASVASTFTSLSGRWQP